MTTLTACAASPPSSTATPYQATLDGNEQYHDIDEVIALWRRIVEEPRLSRLKSSIIFIEQPIARDRALSASVKSLSDDIPIEIDESDADTSVFPRARALGYRGISSKSCKGFYRALINRCRIENGMPRSRAATSCRPRT